MACSMFVVWTRAAGSQTGHFWNHLSLKDTHSLTTSIIINSAVTPNIILGLQKPWQSFYLNSNTVHSFYQTYIWPSWVCRLPFHLSNGTPWQLPIELWEYVIDCIHADRTIGTPYALKLEGRDTLRNCSLVCRAWLHRARLHLNRLYWFVQRRNTGFWTYILVESQSVVKQHAFWCSFSRTPAHCLSIRPVDSTQISQHQHHGTPWLRSDPRAYMALSSITPSFCPTPMSFN